MGIGLAVVSWVFKGTILASALAVLVGTLTARLVPRGRARRTRLILWACVYPFACFVWLLSVFVFQAYGNEAWLYRDAGIGETWQTPLPNGYAVLLLDEQHDGTVFNPKTHFSSSSDNEIHPDGPDAVSGVRVIQIENNKILGGAGPLGQYSSKAARDRVDYYFLLDTDAHTRTDYANYDDLTRAVTALGISPHLEPLFDVYERYRFTWFDLSAILLALVPVVVAGWFLWHRIRWLRRSQPPATPILEPPALRPADKQA
jgi:hypothetical protein